MELKKEKPVFFCWQLQLTLVPLSVGNRSASAVPPHPGWGLYCSLLWKAVGLKRGMNTGLLVVGERREKTQTLMRSISFDSVGLSREKNTQIQNRSHFILSTKGKTTKDRKERRTKGNRNYNINESLTFRHLFIREEMLGWLMSGKKRTKTKTRVYC